MRARVGYGYVAEEDREPDFRRRALAVKPPQRMTTRMVEVLSLAAQGLTNEQIARELEIDIETVKTHIKKILVSLGVHSRVQAVYLAASRGIIALAEEDE